MGLLLPLGAQNNQDSFILQKSPRMVPEVPFPQTLHQWAWEGTYKKGTTQITFWISTSPYFFLQGSSEGKCPGFKTQVSRGPLGFYVLWETPWKSSFAFLFPSESFEWCVFLDEFKKSYEGVQSLNKGKNPLAMPAFIKTL